MTITLLLDLDDTLLGNDIDRFLPAYIKLLGKHLVDFVPADAMVKHLLTATQGMIDNNSAEFTLEHAFDKVFYPAIGWKKEDLKSSLEAFYLEHYGQLQSLTMLRPEALDLVEDAIRDHHTVVVATNPLFPREAAYQRLRWAGLDPEKVPFNLITDFEHFHFSKPNPAFLAEVLAQLGWPNQPAVMVGNSLEEDILPAVRLGLPAFWVHPTPAELPKGAHPLSAVGELKDVSAWLKTVDSAGIRLDLNSPDALIAILKSTPAVFETLRQSLTETQWSRRPAPDDWSLGEIFCHLRDVDREVNFPRIHAVISEDNPFIPGIDTDQWAEERDYFHQDGRTALQEFITTRCRLIECLEKLPQPAWERRARHAIFGPTSLKDLVSFTVTHDQNHIQQVQSNIRALA